MLHELVEPDAIFGMILTQCPSLYFVFGITRQSTKHAVDKIFSPRRMRERLVQSSHVMRSFHELHCNLWFPNKGIIMSVINVKYLKYILSTLYSIIRKIFVILKGIFVFLGILGHWTKYHGIFFNNGKRGFRVLRKMSWDFPNILSIPQNTNRARIPNWKISVPLKETN